MKNKIPFLVTGLVLAALVSQSAQSGFMSSLTDRGKNPRDCMQGLSDKGESLNACLKAEREGGSRNYAKCVNDMPEADQTSYRNCMDEKNKSLLK
ncbi:MAG: hypothetical protein SFT81_01590 [Candidatus Caenarcaniphilales bacterium]|nr:hypothetical protein [Candidatus Caenarcaniphilales bacterium]